MDWVISLDVGEHIAAQSQASRVHIAFCAFSACAGSGSEGHLPSELAETGWPGHLDKAGVCAMGRAP